MTEIDADRPSYTNDRAQVTEEMVNVYIETMWPDLWSSRRAIGDLRAQVRIGLTAARAAAPKPDRPSAENIGRLVKAAGRALGALQNSSDMISSDINMAYDGKKWAQRPIDDLDAALAPFTGQATAPKPDRPTPPPPSSARPENGSETMAEVARDMAAEDFAIMLRRMIWQTRKATGDDSMKVLAGQAEALLSRHGMPGNPLRADGPTPQPGEAADVMVPAAVSEAAPAAAGAPAPIDPADLERASYPTIDGRVGALERRCDAIAGRLAALERRQIAVGEAASPILVASSRVDWECAIRGLAAALEDDGR